MLMTAVSYCSVPQTEQKPDQAMQSTSESIAVNKVHNISVNAQQGTEPCAASITSALLHYVILVSQRTSISIPSKIRRNEEEKNIFIDLENAELNPLPLSLLRVTKKVSTKLSATLNCCLYSTTLPLHHVFNSFYIIMKLLQSAALRRQDGATREQVPLTTTHNPLQQPAECLRFLKD
ncbi:hypothetical protein PoB_002012200 [Plakobranchus ocellatus]|uniref:Uncharacterized protein n=1 Tax=Plakobranchus ocellatus TaxID=259542 RepID=A0AAV3ZEA6_9GAST|nr:hypothetical protein PoB_002012200 [Plakobranchus ocellatus]